MKKIYQFFGIFLISSILFTSCEKTDTPDPDPTGSEYSLGWTGDDDVTTIPTTVDYGFGSGNFPPSVDLVPKFPPIGNQGAYGTCVAWAIGYSTKTAVNGMANGYGPSDLSSPSKQFSPKDLYIAISDNNKGDGTDLCKGTGFTIALDVLQSRGVATLATVPYDNLGDCSQSNLDASWATEANQNKIKYYRRIDPTVTSIKENLANNVPVILGGKLADNFMSWNSDDVMSSNTTYDRVGIHAYHAMVIAGYDDNRGPNGAFKVINSWGPGWGNNGTIWIDYNFMISEFCSKFQSGRPLFIMANEDGNINPPDDPDPNVNGVDVVPWVFSDISVDDWNAERQIEFNVYNIGNQTADPSANWSYVYIYYNAYNADDYGVLFLDEFNTSIPQGTYECPNDYNCIINFPIASGGGFAETVWGTQSLYRSYFMPNITGFYYLLMVADAGDVFQEQDELNNLFYTTTDPAWFVGGVALKSTEKNSQPLSFRNDINFEKNKAKRTKFNSAVNSKNLNAYTPEEIKRFIKKRKANGDLDKKIATYKKQTSPMHAK